mgnify:CR=1 FL=1
MNARVKATQVLAIMAAMVSIGYGNWTDSFDGGQFGLQWTFVSFPQVTGTFKQTIEVGEGGNPYLTFTETTAVSKGGSAFAAGFGSSEKFKDVQVNATVNVAGDSRYCYYGLIARASYFIDKDGKLTGVAPGFVADGYILHVDYSNGPANVAINIEKVKMNQNVMDKNVAASIPTVLGARSFYAQLEVVGAGPVTVTGRLYESKGGALLAQVSFVDTDAKDPWEDANKAEKVFTEGLCGIFAQNEQGDRRIEFGEQHRPQQPQHQVGNIGQRPAFPIAQGVEVLPAAGKGVRHRVRVRAECSQRSVVGKHRVPRQQPVPEQQRQDRHQQQQSR